MINIPGQIKALFSGTEILIPVESIFQPGGKKRLIYRKYLLGFFKCVAVYFVGYSIGFLFFWCVSDFAHFKTIAFHWQELIGSFIGAATPLGLFFLTKWLQEKEDRKQYLLLLEKNIITAINNLADVDRMLHAFQDIQLTSFKNGLEEDDKLGRPCVGQAFIPLSWTFTMEKEIFAKTTGSSYLENLIMKVMSISQEMPILLQDLSRQFDRTINLNTQLGLMKLNEAKVHNQVLRNNIQEFEIFLNLQTFGNNIPIYLRLLVQTKVALQAMTKLGFKKWKQNFAPLGDFSIDVSSKVEAYFAPQVNIEINELKETFKSKLLLVGEEPQNPYSNIEA